MPELASYIDQPQLPELIRYFLFEQLNTDPDLNPILAPLANCPQFSGHIHVYHSAIVRFYAPSDPCGAGGMYHKLICSNPSWHGEGACRNTVFVMTNPDHDGFWGMCVGRVYLFFSFVYEGVDYHCALVHWFTLVGDSVHEETGQWVVEPKFLGDHHNHCKYLAAIHVDCITCGALLSPIYGSGYLPDNFHFSTSLDALHTYFVNNYANHHMHEFVPKFNQSSHCLTTCYKYLVFFVMANSWPTFCLAGLVLFHGEQKSFTSLAEFCTFPDVETCLLFKSDYYTEPGSV